MASPENKPEIQASSIEPLSMPARVEDGTNSVLVERSESGVLFVRVLHGKQPLFSAAVTPDNAVNIVFQASNLSPAPPFPLQAELPQPEQKQAKEKEAALIVTGSFEKETMYRQVNITNKQTHQKEAQWLHKFLLRLPGETPDATRLQTVTSLGKTAQRHKQLGLHSGEELEVRGYMQHRKDMKTNKETEELFAFTVRRTKPPEQQQGA